jgi:N,N'-diacetyllegionaminate synthase
MTKIIADACANHLGDRRIIQKMIESASEVGVDFIKFQAFEAMRLNADEDYWVKQFQYYNDVQLKKDDYFFIMDLCKKHSISPMFTVFHVETIPFLKEIGVEIVKIASPDSDNMTLIHKCMNTFDDVIVSTGMSTPSNKRELLNIGCAVLHCVSRYPAKYEDYDIDNIGLYDGISDHTPDLLLGMKAIDLGVEYFERHFTLGKHLPGKDHLFSSTPDEFKELVEYRNYKTKVKLFKNRWR